MPTCPHCGQPMPEPEDESERARKHYRFWSRDMLLRERKRYEGVIGRIEGEIADPPKSGRRKTLAILSDALEYARTHQAVVEELLALPERTEAA